MAALRPRILVTGASGLLGPYVCEAASRRGSVVPLSRSVGGAGHVRADLTDADATSAVLARVRPDVVIHAAAYANVDGCEADPQFADSMNRAAARYIAQALPPTARLIYVSTDQVYPDRAGPHVEGTEAPVNVYGRTKLAGELEALAHPRGVAIRTNFFGQSRTSGRSSLSDFFVDRFSSGAPVTLFTDVLFSPLHVTTLAELLLDFSETECVGAFNLGCSAGLSKADFAFAVASHAGLTPKNVTFGESTDLPGRAARGRDLRLDVRRAERVLGRPLPSLLEEVSRL